MPLPITIAAPTQNPQPNPQPTSSGTVSLDPSVVALAQAIRQTESQGNFNAVGDNGTSKGAYQWQTPTWQAQAKEFLGDPNAEMTPANQNAVAYARISQLKNQGLNPAEIAATWNSGSAKGWENKIGTTIINGKPIAYNVPAYVKKVTDFYQQFKNNSSQLTGIPVAEASTGIPTPIQDNSPSVGGFIENIAKSAGGVLQGLGSAILHPINTVENLAQTAIGIPEALAGQNNENTQKLGNLIDYFKNRYGGDSVSQVVQNIGNSVYKDPVGVALDFSTLLDGVGGSLEALGKIGALDATQAAEIAKASDYISTASGLVKSGSPEALKALQEPSTLTKIGNAIQTVSDYTNPLAPLTKTVGGIANKISDITDNLPRRIVNNILPQLKNPGTLDYAIDNLKLGSTDSMLKTSNDALSNYNSQIKSILTHPENIDKVINGEDIANTTLKQFPNSEYTPDTIFAKVKQQLPGEAALVTKLQNGSLSLDEANTLRQAADSASYKSVIDSPEIKASKKLLSSFGNSLRESVKTAVPETRDIFANYSKEINLNKALLKLSNKVGKSGIISTKDLLGALSAGGIGGVPVGIATLVGEKVGKIPIARIGAAKILKSVSSPVKAITKTIAKVAPYAKEAAFIGKTTN